MSRQYCGVVAAVIVLALAACGDRDVNSSVRSDAIPPTVQILKTSGDTVDVATNVTFDVVASDNLGIRNLRVTLSGALSQIIDTTFTTAVTSFTQAITITFPANTTVGGTLFVLARVIDGADNTATDSTDIVLLNNSGLFVTLVRPAAGSVTSAGRQLVVEVAANQPSGVKKIGYLVSGVFAGGDSTSLPFPFPDSTNFIDTLSVPGSAPEGVFTILPFAEDSSGARGTGGEVSVLVQSVTSDDQPPSVRHKVGKRIEVEDTVRVDATDPSGITLVGYRIRLLNGTVIDSNSVTFSGSFTDESQIFITDLGLTNFPTLVTVEGFADDAATPPNRGVSTLDGIVGAAPKIDTVTAVAGRTVRLPAGGKIADAIFNPNRDELIMTNIVLDRLEVFSVVDTQFVASIPVGAVPVGIALWPRDTLGANADTVVTANSGGTNLSIVDVSNARIERRRHRLPNFILETVQTEIDPATGTVKVRIDPFDFSDRPQFLGMTCRVTGAGSNCDPNQIIAFYSTTPTPSQPDPFPFRATLRWENLTAVTPQSHFVYEHARHPPSPESDTLQLFADRPWLGTTDTIVGGAAGFTILTERIGFRDSTFVRNSGNFTAGFSGEGGVIEDGFGRALLYDSRPGLTISVGGGATVLGVVLSDRLEFDPGISAPIRVSDFVSNTATSVKAVATNFNARTNLIRADSIYIVDKGLRLQGLVDVGGKNPGMDLNAAHAFDAAIGGTPTFGGTGNPNDRLLFAAQETPRISVYDTFFYGQVASIPIRDPIIGPLRVARTAGGQQILVGVTRQGIVIVQIPTIANIFPIVGGEQ